MALFVDEESDTGDHLYTDEAESGDGSCSFTGEKFITFWQCDISYHVSPMVHLL